jgi:hypothetical protein
VGAPPPLLVVSVALFVAGARAKRDAVKRWAVGVLGIGIGAAWMPFIVMVLAATEA